MAVSGYAYLVGHANTTFTLVGVVAPDDSPEELQPGAPRGVIVPAGEMRYFAVRGRVRRTRLSCQHMSRCWRGMPRFTQQARRMMWRSALRRSPGAWWDT